MKRFNTKLFIGVFIAGVALLFAMVARQAAMQDGKTVAQPSDEKDQSVSLEKVPPTVSTEADIVPMMFERSLGKKRAAEMSTAASAAIVGANLGEETEPNDSAGTADSLGSNPEGKIKGYVFPNADTDFYVFTTTAANTRIYVATMTSFSASASVDSFLEVRAADGTTVLESDNDDGSFGTTSSSIAGLNLATAGTYYVVVRHNLATAQIRPYDLYVSTRSAAPTGEVEGNDTSGTANPVPASGHISGSTSSTADQDWFSITLNAGDTIYASLDMDPERDTTTWNGGLGLATFNNFVLTVNDGNLTSPNSEAHFITIRDAGTYFIRVQSPTGGTTFGTYNLNVTVIPRIDAASGCTTYVSTDVPQTIPTGPGQVSSTLTVPGNPRIEKMRVLIGLDHTFMADLDVHLRSPAGNDNGLFTDIGNTTSPTPTGLGDMDITLDDDFGIPLNSFTVQSPIGYKPELNYRLDWFHGELAGGTWTLDIRDDATGDGGTLNSWGIEICEAPPLLGNVIYSENFDGGGGTDGGFTHSGVQDEWERGLPNTVLGTPPQNVHTTCNSGTNCWKTDLDNTYNASSNQDLFSPVLNLTQYTGTINLEWAMRYQIESATFDNAFVEVIDIDNAANNRVVWRWYGATMTNTVGSPAVTLQETAGWGNYRADISDFSGRRIQLRFNLSSDTTVQLSGMAIDDVQLRHNGPTAANANLAGRVVTADGSGISRATVTVSGGGIESRTVMTNSFGYYSIGDLPVGRTYVVTVGSKQYTFAIPSRTVTLNDTVNDFGFVAEPEE